MLRADGNGVKVVRRWSAAKNRHKVRTHREAVAADVLIVERHGHPHSDVSASLYRRGRHGEVLRVVSSQKHLEHAVHAL